MKNIWFEVVLPRRKLSPKCIDLARECVSIQKYRKRSSVVPVPFELLGIVTPEGEKKWQSSSVTVSSEGGGKCQEGQSKAFKQSGLRLKIDETKWSVMKTQREREWGTKVQAEESGILFSQSAIITPWNRTVFSSSKKCAKASYLLDVICWNDSKKLK